MKPPRMQSGPALFFQVIIVLLGLGALAFLLGEPHVEGRNAHATPFEIYFKDPFLAYVYFGSIPFFIALYHAFRLFGHVRRNGAFSHVTVTALRAIKRCAMALIGFIAGGIVIIIIFGDGEDRPPGIFMGMLLAFATSAIAVGAAAFARNLQAALDRNGAQQA